MKKMSTVFFGQSLLTDKFYGEIYCEIFKFCCKVPLKTTIWNTKKGKYT